MTDQTAMIAWAKQVSGALDGEWTSGPRGAGAELRRASDGLTLFVREVWNRPGRVEVSLSCDWDKVPYAVRDAARHSITLSASKTPEQAARDVAQRLVSIVEPVHAAIQQADSERAAYAARLERRVTACAAILGTRSKIIPGVRERPNRVEFGTTSSGVCGHYDVDVEGGVSIEATLDPETARAVLALIAERLAAQRKRVA